VQKRRIFRGFCEIALAGPGGVKMADCPRLRRGYPPYEVVRIEGKSWMPAFAGMTWGGRWIGANGGAAKDA